MLAWWVDNEGVVLYTGRCTPCIFYLFFFIKRTMRDVCFKNRPITFRSNERSKERDSSPWCKREVCQNQSMHPLKSWLEYGPLNIYIALASARIAGSVHVYNISGGELGACNLLCGAHYPLQPFAVMICVAIPNSDRSGENTFNCALINGSLSPSAQIKRP